ncbi:MAG: hypothetical protein ABSH25_16845 [Syntrophorhabdales bacterium]
MITGYQAESAIKTYTRTRKLGIWHIVGAPNADSMGDLVTISEEGMKKQFSDKTTSANGETARPGHGTNNEERR